MKFRFVHEQDGIRVTYMSDDGTQQNIRPLVYGWIELEGGALMLTYDDTSTLTYDDPSWSPPPRSD